MACDRKGGRQGFIVRLAFWPGRLLLHVGRAEYTGSPASTNLCHTHRRRRRGRRCCRHRCRRCVVIIVVVVIIVLVVVFVVAVSI